MGGKTQTSWKPGQSGNPAGRPKNDQSITAILRELGQSRVTITDSEGKKVKIERYKAILLRAYALALNGDMAAIKFIASYRDGMPPQDINLNGTDEDGGRLPFVVNIIKNGAKPSGNGNGHGSTGS